MFVVNVSNEERLSFHFETQNREEAEKVYLTKLRDVANCRSGETVSLRENGRRITVLNEVEDLINDLRSIDGDRNKSFLGTSAKAEETVQRNINDKDYKVFEASKSIEKENVRNKNKEMEIE